MERDWTLIKCGLKIRSGRGQALQWLKIIIMFLRRGLGTYFVVRKGQSYIRRRLLLVP
jgi:hypothetical protein